MAGQHDQNATPGYVGPHGAAGIGEGDTPEHNDGVVDRVRDAAQGPVGGDREQVEEQATLDPGKDMDPQQRIDTGIGTADISGSPYAGSAGSQALEAVEERVPGDGLEMTNPE